MAVAVADRLIDSRMREAVVGDLVEAYDAEPISSLGRARAGLWFWRQVLFAIAHFPRRPQLAHTYGDGLVTGFLDDLARAARTLRRAPVFTIACAATLGIGIGAATVIFSVADPVILRPLPYTSPERLFAVWQNDVDGRRSRLGFATIADISAAATSFDYTAAAANWQPTLNIDGAGERLEGLRVSWSYFRTLGVSPALGQDFAQVDDTPANSAVVIISDLLWRTRFAGESAIVGSSIDIGGRRMRVAGVMPRGFDDALSPAAQVWRVLGYEATQSFACRTCQHLRMIARVRPGVTESAALAELNLISARLVRDYPTEYPVEGMQIVQEQREATRDIRPALVALLVAVVLLLVIATVNVGGLQLARALQRDEEFAVRSALGAGGGRLTRLLLAEGLVLASVAGVVGWVVARVGIVQLVNRLPATIPRLGAIHLDARAFALAALVTLSAGIVIGLVPAWHARRSALALSLRGGRRVGGTPHRVRALFVVTEVALAVMLMAGAGLLARSLGQLLAVDVGVELERVATAQVQVSGPRYPNGDALLAWQDQMIAAARAVPGVENVAISSQLPLGGNFDSYGVNAEDKPLTNPGLAPSGDRYTVTPGFIGTMGIPLIAGRDFTESDNALAGAPVAIVSQSLARRIWGDEDPLGKRIQMGGPDAPWYDVVGVVGDVHHRGLDVAETMQFYVPTRRWFFAQNAVDVVVRTSGDPGAVLPMLRRALLTPDPSAVVTRLTTMAEVRARSTAQRTLALSLFSVFALIALLLAVAGIFGALAGTVAERRREIGLRSALGATPSGIIGLVLRQGMLLAGGGVAIGLAGAFAGGRAIEAMLFGVGSNDIVTIGGVTLLIGVAAVAASVIPAWRAVRVDPITALRAD